MNFMAGLLFKLIFMSINNYFYRLITIMHIIRNMYFCIGVVAGQFAFFINNVYKSRSFLMYLLLCSLTLYRVHMLCPH